MQSQALPKRNIKLAENNGMKLAKHNLSWKTGFLVK
jgi:hypothetical protein